MLCLAVGSTDSDVLTTHCQAKGETPAQTLKIRLAEIDAPEKRQAFGERSKQALASLCFNQRAEVHPEKLDRYGRTIGTVRCRGEDASAAQVRAGMAWVYVQYASPGSRLFKLQADARTSRAGLWVDAAPLAPWEWRGLQRAKDGRGQLPLVVQFFTICIRRG